MARRPAGRSRKGAVRTINFRGVSTKRPVLPEDDYLVAVDEISIEQGDTDEYYKWIFAVIEGKHEGAKLYYNTSLAPQALFNLRGLLEALGIEVPDDEFDVDPKEVVGAEMMAVVGQERYQGKLQSKIQDFYAVDGDADDKKPAGRKSRSDDDEEEKPARRGRRAEPEEEGDDKSVRRGRASKNDDDDRPSGGRRGAGKKKGPDPISAEEVEEMSQKELEDLVEKLELDLDFAKLRTLTKQRNAVIDALNDAGLLDG